ncbi:DctP family TRAP transporter solute-binding subunit [Oceanobacillus alkalisoli]|uniref:DctP family TRAP transporter solute-binding subunit n=1 Tax=Oceanobacillus alkalisoli TaxID=2925113 RepID=UPI001F11D194|nr:DctP family TRAP transporter solute-binding subunit [Oceanobacillus alkalisoli]MCF3942904.1 DctP family TRAP transporter solute-binding subunit [Oceanobacillus alkalisoli]
MSNKWKLSFFAILLVFVLAACSDTDGEGGSGDSVTLQLGHALTEGTPASDLIEEMAAEVEEQTEGRVTFDIYPNSQLGSETEMLEQVQLGSMESAAIMVGSMQALDTRMAIEDLPYMWKDIEHAREAYKGEFGDYLADIMAEQDMTKIGYLEWGFRHITNNRGPIVEPEDLEGLNIRVAETKLRVDAFEQLGALPTVMAFSEVYGALQQGAIDAQENPLANTVLPKFYEVQDYLSLTGHFYNTIMLVVSTDVWDSISEEDQEIIIAEAERIQDEVTVMNDEQEDTYIQELIDNGMQVNDDVNADAFREAMMPVYDKWEEDVFGEEMMDIYREASGW